MTGRIFAKTQQMRKVLHFRGCNFLIGRRRFEPRASDSGFELEAHLLRQFADYAHPAFGGALEIWGL